MSNPNLEDGWIQTACELDAAIDLADFTKAESVVLGSVKRQLYGAFKQRSASIVIADLAACGGWKRQFIEKGIRGLVLSNVLRKGGESDYTLNKYYRTWKFSAGSTHPDGNGSRFSNAELSYILGAKLFKSDQNTLSNQRVAKRATNELQTDQALQPTSCTNATNELHPMQPTSCINATNELHSHIEDHAHRIRLNSEKRENPLPPEQGDVITVATLLASEDVRGAVFKLVMSKSGDEATAEIFAQSAAMHVKRDGYSASEVLSSWGNVVDSKTSRCHWSKTVASNLGRRKVRAEVAENKIRADTEAGRAAKELARYPVIVPDPNDPDRQRFADRQAEADRLDRERVRPEGWEDTLAKMVADHRAKRRRA